MTRRDLQAQQTRRDLVDAARRLFADRGFAKTSVRDVAAAANVSVQTVYDSVGPKPALLLALNDVLDEEAEIGALVGAAMASGSSDELVALPARISRSVLDHAGDIVRTIVGAAPNEEAAAAALAEGRRRHGAGIRAVVEQWSARGLLADGVTVDDAAETVSALSDPAMVLVLHDAHGWSSERIEGWLNRAFRAILLA